MRKALTLLPLLILAACNSNDPEQSKSYMTISFENCTFADGAHNNMPDNNSRTEYTEAGATFTALNYYYSLVGIMVADNGEKPQTSGEYIGYSNGKCVVCNTEVAEGEVLPMGADGTSKYSVWSFSSYLTSDIPSFSFADGAVHKAVSMKVNNDASVWQKLKIGYYSKPAFTSGDYFDAIFTGYDAAGNPTASVTVPLADFRDGKSVLVENWTEVNLSPLGYVNKIELTADFSENFISLMYGMSADACPYMVCVDEIKFDVTGE